MNGLFGNPRREVEQTTLTARWMQGIHWGGRLNPQDAVLDDRWPRSYHLLIYTLLVSVVVASSIVAVRYLVLFVCTQLFGNLTGPPRIIRA